MAFYQKYRSKTFDELIGQDHVAKTLLESVKSDKLVHAYLLTGPRGIGKTSTARLLAKAINCIKLHESRITNHESSGEPCNECESCKDINEGKSLDVIEIDAASHTGVDDIRDLIEKARFAPTKSAKKVYIIDEVHMLSKSAFNALLKTLEEPPNHVVFIMATTEVYKVPATILSRVQRFDFKRATKAEIIENLKRVAKLEKIEIDEESLELIAVSAAGGHRDALSLLEQVSSAAKGKINIEKTRQILGIAQDSEAYAFIGAIFNNNPEEGLKIARRVFDSGLDLSDFNLKVIGLMRKIMICKAAGPDFLDDTKENNQKTLEFSGMIELSRILEIINLFLDSNRLLKDVSYPLLPLEIAVVKATNPKVESRKLKVESKETLESIGQNQVSKEEIAEEKKLDTKRDLTEVAFSKEKPVNEKSATVPVPVVDMTKDIWDQIIDQMKKENSTLAALLRDARPEETTANTMTLGVKFKFHKDRITEPKNCEILERIVSDVTGSKYKVACRISDGKAQKKVNNDDKVNLEEAVIEIFEV